MGREAKMRFMPEAVSSKIRDQMKIVSLTQCVEELVYNSLDASCRSVNVVLDLDPLRPCIQVIDDGVGMSSKSLEVVGDRHWTSKMIATKDEKERKMFGYAGESLANIRGISETLKITSQMAPSSAHFIEFVNGARRPVKPAERIEIGTAIAINGLFWNQPVRRKGLKPQVVMGNVKRLLSAIALNHPNKVFTLWDHTAGNKELILETKRDSSCYGMLKELFSHVFSDSFRKNLRQVKYEKDYMSVKGLVSITGHSNKNIQFISVNKRYVVDQELTNIAVDVIKEASRSVNQKINNPVFILSLALKDEKVEKCYFEYVDNNPAVQFRAKEIVHFHVRKALSELFQREGLMKVPKPTLQVDSLLMTGIKPLPPGNSTVDIPSRDILPPLCLQRPKEKEFIYSPNVRGARTGLPYRRPNTSCEPYSMSAVAYGVPVILKTRDQLPSIKHMDNDLPEGSGNLVPPQVGAGNTDDEKENTSTKPPQSLASAPNASQLKTPKKLLVYNGSCVMSGIKPIYALGDESSVSCTSGSIRVVGLTKTKVLKDSNKGLARCANSKTENINRQLDAYLKQLELSEASRDRTSYSSQDSREATPRNPRGVSQEIWGSPVNQLEIEKDECTIVELGETRKKIVVSNNPARSKSLETPSYGNKRTYTSHKEKLEADILLFNPHNAQVDREELRKKRKLDHDFQLKTAENSVGRKLGHIDTSHSVGLSLDGAGLVEQSLHQNHRPLGEGPRVVQASFQRSDVSQKPFTQIKASNAAGRLKCEGLNLEGDFVDKRDNNGIQHLEHGYAAYGPQQSKGEKKKNEEHSIGKEWFQEIFVDKEEMVLVAQKIKHRPNVLRTRSTEKGKASTIQSNSKGIRLIPKPFVTYHNGKRLINFSQVNVGALVNEVNGNCKESGEVKLVNLEKRFSENKSLSIDLYNKKCTRNLRNGNQGTSLGFHLSYGYLNTLGDEIRKTPLCDREVGTQPLVQEKREKTKPGNLGPVPRLENLTSSAEYNPLEHTRSPYFKAAPATDSGYKTSGYTPAYLCPSQPIKSYVSSYAMSAKPASIPVVKSAAPVTAYNSGPGTKGVLDICPSSVIKYAVGPGSSNLVFECDALSPTLGQPLPVSSDSYFQYDIDSHEYASPAMDSGYATTQTFNSDCMLPPRIEYSHRPLVPRCSSGSPQDLFPPRPSVTAPAFTSTPIKAVVDTAATPATGLFSWPEYATAQRRDPVTSTELPVHPSGQHQSESGLPSAILFGGSGIPASPRDGSTEEQDAMPREEFDGILDTLGISDMLHDIPMEGNLIGSLMANAEEADLNFLDDECDPGSRCNFNIASPTISETSPKDLFKPNKIRSVILPYKIEKLTTKRRIDFKKFKPNRVHYQQNSDELTVRLNSDPVTSLKTDIIDYSNCRQTLSDVPSLTFYRTHFSVPEIVLSLDRDMDVTRDPVKITKDMLSDNHFIGQIENKFLATVSGGLVLLWDQHALHERIRLEHLQARYLIEEDGASKVLSGPPQETVILDISDSNIAVLKNFKDSLAAFGLKMSGRVVVESPLCFQNLPSARQIQLSQKLVDEFVSLVELGAVMPRVPSAVHAQLCSTACRGAIMFGQEISESTARGLLSQISSCAAPFQCAHGRPSIAPVIDINSL